MYKISFSDKSYMFVNDDFKLILFHKNNFNEKLACNIKEYTKDKFHEYTLCDKINNRLVPLSFDIEQVDGINIKQINLRIKKVEDIQQFDKILGPDGTSRTVIDLHSGEDDMFEIETEEGIKHIVNGDHTLVLVNKENDNDKTTISVKGYLNMDNSFKDKYKLMKVNF